MQTNFIEAMMPQHSQRVQRLHTVATDVVGPRQRVGKRDGKHSQRLVTSDVGRRRRLDVMLTSVGVEHDFRCLDLVEPQVVVSCPCCYVAKNSNKRISTSDMNQQVGPTCHLQTSPGCCQRAEV